MPGKMAIVNYHKCRPDECNQGVCKAIPECPLKLIRQEFPNEIPMTNPSSCRGCSACARACPLKAIEVVRI